MELYYDDKNIDESNEDQIQSSGVGGNNLDLANVL